LNNHDHGIFNPATRAATGNGDELEQSRTTFETGGEMSRNEESLRAMFVDLERLDFDAVAERCTQDCVYEDVPFEAATVIGPAAIRAKLDMGLGALERLPTTIHELIEAGDTMMVERTEVWHHPSGERATLRVAAVFKFRNGRIRLWRDYWDAKTLFDQQPESWLPDVPRF
jgi:limonene-1,2-epoxide hydrolase